MERLIRERGTGEGGEKKKKASLINGWGKGNPAENAWLYMGFHPN